MPKMPFNNLFQIDLKKLSEESLKSVDQLSKQFVQYEKRVKKLVHEMDVSTRDARKQARERLDGFLEDLRGRRDGLEKKVADLVQTESKRINEGVQELVGYLKQLRANAPASGAAKKSTVATASAKPPKGSGGGNKKKATAKKASPSKATASRKKPAMKASEASAPAAV